MKSCRMVQPQEEHSNSQQEEKGDPECQILLDAHLEDDERHTRREREEHSHQSVQGGLLHGGALTPRPLGKA
jgi:hypothetical protein